MKRIVCAILFSTCILPFFCAVTSCQKTADTGTMYEINAEYVPETSTVTGTVKLEYENTTDNELSVLKFNLFANAYREDAVFRPVSTAYVSTAYYNGKNYGGMEISSVNGAKSWDITGEDCNVLSVTLEESVFPGEKVVLDVGFLTKLAKVNHRTGVTKHTVNLGNFFPILCAYGENGFY